MVSEVVNTLMPVFVFLLVSIVGLQVWVVKMLFGLSEKFAVQEEKHASHERAIKEINKDVGALAKTVDTLHLRIQGVPVRNYREDT